MLSAKRADQPAEAGRRYSCNRRIGEENTPGKKRRMEGSEGETPSQETDEDDLEETKEGDGRGLGVGCPVGRPGKRGGSRTKDEAEVDGHKLRPKVGTRWEEKPRWREMVKEAPST